MGKRSYLKFIFLLLVIFLIGGVHCEDVSKSDDAIETGDKAPEVASKDSGFFNEVKTIFNVYFGGSGKEEGIVSNVDKGLWGPIKGEFSKFGSFFRDKLLWVVGGKTFGGESNNILSKNYWENDAKEYFFFGCTISFWLVLFHFFLLFIRRISPRSNINIPSFKLSKLYLPPLLFIILMGVPVINRFLQLVTLEFLGVHWVWRSLIIAVVISFYFPFREKYREYYKRKYLYDKKMERYAIDELVKVRLRK